MTYRDVVLADSPIAYWRLGESSGTIAYDELGNYDGDYVGSPTLGAASALVGDSDKSVGFSSATAQYVSVSGFTAPTSAISYEIWWKCSNASAQGVIGQGDGNNGSDLAMNSGFYRFWTAGANISTPTEPAYNIGFHHVVATYDGTYGRIYVDGVLKVGPTSLPSPTAYAQPLLIGKYGTILGGNCNGGADEAAVYDYALSDAQVLAHYQAGAWISGGLVPLILTSPLTPGEDADAGVGSVTVTAEQPSKTVAPNAGNAAVTVTAPSPTAKPGAGAENAGLTVTANQASVGSGPSAGNAAATITAQAPAGSVAPNAGGASVTVTANQPTASAAPPAGSASVTITSASPTPSVSPSAGVASITITANQPTVDTGGVSTNAYAGLASVVLAAEWPDQLAQSDLAQSDFVKQASGNSGASASVKPNAETASVTVSSNQPKASSSASAGAASVSVTAAGVSASVKSSAGAAIVTISANDATVTASGAGTAPAEAASLAITANDATVLSAPGGGRGKHKPKWLGPMVKEPEATFAHALPAVISIRANGADTKSFMDEANFLLGLTEEALIYGVC